MIFKISTLSLAKKAALTAVAIFVCGFMPLIYFTTASLEKNITELLVNQQTSMVNHIADNVEQRIMLRIKSLQDAAALLPPKQINDQVAVSNFLKQRAPVSRLFENGMAVISRDGHGVADYPVIPNRATSDYRDSEYFKEVLATGQPSLGKPRIGHYTHKPEIAIAVPIMDSQGTLVGVLAGFLGLTDKSIFNLAHARLGKTGAITLVSSADKIIIADTDRTHTLMPIAQADHGSMTNLILDGVSHTMIINDLYGNRAIVTDAHILSGRWVVLGSLPTDEAFAPIKQLKQQIYAAATVILILAGSIIWWVMNLQLNIIGRATQSLRKMTSGDTPLHALQVDRNDEIGEMLMAFNKLQEEIQTTAASLRSSEGRSRAIIEAMPVPIALNDEQGNITYLNKAFLQTVGYTNDDIPTLTDWWPRAYPDQQYRLWVVESWQRKMEESRRTNVPFSPLELNVRCKDGSLRTFMAAAAPLKDYFTGTHLVILYDITDRKRADESLLKLSLAVEQSPNSIIITDLDAHIEYVNAAFTRASGYSLDEVIGKNPSILQSGKTPKSTYESMWASLTRGQTWRGELVNLRKDGSEYIDSVLISPVEKPNGLTTNYLAIQEDITEKKDAEKRIEKLAHFDQLTGLPNLGLLKDRFKYSISLAQRSGEPLAVMFLDLDHFKNINDSLGHNIGDQLLMEVSRRIKTALREEDTVARQGGDEFTLILPGTDADGAALVATKLLSLLPPK